MHFDFEPQIPILGPELLIWGEGGIKLIYLVGWPCANHNYAPSFCARWLGGKKILKNVLFLEPSALPLRPKMGHSDDQNKGAKNCFCYTLSFSY